MSLSVFQYVPYKETRSQHSGCSNLNNFRLMLPKIWVHRCIIERDVGDGLMGIDRVESISSLLKAGMLKRIHLERIRKEPCNVRYFNKSH
jgi:hypothetical protein